MDARAKVLWQGKGRDGGGAWADDGGAGEERGC
jgi:hypothetical protein